MAENEKDFEGLYDVSYVTADGTFGTGGIVLFDYDSLTGFQWQVLDSIADSDKMSYVLAILNKEDLSEWETYYRESEGN